MTEIDKVQRQTGTNILLDNIYSTYYINYVQVSDTFAM